MAYRGRGRYGRGYSSGTTSRFTKSSENPVRIFWAPEFNAYGVKTPDGGATFSQDMRLIDNVKWEASPNNIWLVPESKLSEAIAVVTMHFEGYTPEITEKPNTNGVLQDINVTDAATAALKMFQIGGYDNAKRVYSMLVKAYHPDVNPDPNAHNIAAEITTAWRTLKNALGWS
jgi:hypothetical protein